jgi:two-component system cell cycle sensor histidine kinase/response regulator CckA
MNTLLPRETERSAIVACPETILIVEDDIGVARLQRKHLERAGYQVVIATTVAEAMTCARKDLVDLILLDYRLPSDHTGLDFYDQLKNEGYSIPVIIVTGFSDEATVIKALRSGVRDFVTKSVEYLEYLPEAARRVLTQVQTERRLAASEARLTSIIASAKDAIIITDSDHRITLFNAAAERMFRYQAQDALGKSLKKLICYDVDSGLGSSGMVDSSFSNQIRAGSYGVRSDGKTFPLEASVSRVIIEDEKCYTVIVRDITERMARDEQIREQAELLNKANDAIIVCDNRDRITFWNQGAERIYGWNSEEALGQTFPKLLGQAKLSQGVAAEQVFLDCSERSDELRRVAKDRRELVVESHWTSVHDKTGRTSGKLVIETDVTEKLKLQAQLIQAQRMEGIGVLAGGVAHDFNNLLTVITGYCEALLYRTQPSDPSYNLLREIRKAGDRATSLTRQLLAFSRKQIFQLQVIDLNHLVAETEKMLRRLIGEDVDFQTVYAPGLFSIKADPGQLEQVIINLIVNSRDAMPTGGHLTITTRNVELSQGELTELSENKCGSYVMLSVNDTGCGMDESTMKHIFEPFFTTKEAGKGTGLGLATVYGIVKQSGGHITAQSELGRGSTFTIYLPAVAPPPKPQSYSIAGAAKLPFGKETVLLAEDEDAVRSLARLVLPSLGYTLLEASDGDHALQQARVHSGPIHLLVTDVVMPGMSGRKLADTLKLTHPDVKVLFISGYTDDAVVRHGVQDTKTHFLQKPFTPSLLARIIRDILDEKD